MASDAENVDVEFAEAAAFDSDGVAKGDDDGLLLPPPSSAGLMIGSGGDGNRLRRHKKLNRQNSKENNGLGAVGGAVAGGGANGGFIHGPRSWKNSRRSRNGRGLPKKGGAGGKGVWGLPGSELLEDYEDINDPNYDAADNPANGDIELKAVVPALTDAELRHLVEPIVLEYFENGDTHDAAACAEDTVPADRRDALVRYAIEIAMDHKPSHREMTSVLISDLFGNVLGESDIERALEGLLGVLGDLVIDIPDAAVVLGNFIARAIADDCIPPKFIKLTRDRAEESCTTPPEAPSPLIDALTRADTLLSMDHGLVRLHNVWGVGGALRPVKYLTRQMALLLQEFLSSGDVLEASRCLRALEVPHFHHELVYEAIVMALEANRATKEESLCTLLKSFASEILVTPDQMERGFLRVYDDLPDISMDVPLAYILLDRFVDRCYKEGFLTEIVIKRLPSRGRKRFVSEGDQHFFKNHRIA